MSTTATVQLTNPQHLDSDAVGDHISFDQKNHRTGGTVHGEGVVSAVAQMERTKITRVVIDGATHFLNRGTVVEVRRATGRPAVDLPAPERILVQGRNAWFAAGVSDSKMPRQPGVHHDLFAGDITDRHLGSDVNLDVAGARVYGRLDAHVGPDILDFVTLTVDGAEFTMAADKPVTVITMPARRR